VAICQWGGGVIMKHDKIILVVILLLALCLIAVGCKNELGEKKYTYEELCDMPAMELYDLFLEHGLVVDDALNHIPKERMAEIFKREFQFLENGGSFTMSAKGWRELKQDTEAIYEKIKK